MGQPPHSPQGPRRASDTDESVTLTRVIHAPAQKVFEAWIGAPQLKRWLAPIAQADGRVGGRFRLEVQAADGSHVVNGEYRELVSGQRIAMSWVYEGPMIPIGKEATTVTVELHPRGLDTEVRVHHEGLKNPTYRDTIRQGAWAEALKQLDSLLSVRPA
jgi:uncharacterized protein YndB with AHSA1/START domain